MKRLLILLLLTATVFGVGDILVSAKDAGCIEVQGTYYCMKQNYVENIPVKLISDIYCLGSADVSSEKMVELMAGGCYAEVEVTSNIELDIPFRKVHGEIVKEDNWEDIYKKIPIEAGVILDAEFDIGLVKRSDCVEEEIIEDITVRYNCGHQNEMMTMNGVFLMSEGIEMFVFHEKTENVGLLNWAVNNWIYLILGFIAIILIYSVIKRK